MRLEGKRAIVTGAASGIGRATTETLAKAGAHVILADIASEQGAGAASQLQAQGLQASFVALDVGQKESIDNFTEAALDLGPIDILVNGVGWGKVEPFVHNTPEFRAKVLQVNLSGPIELTRSIIPHMIERGSGRIVNVASDAGRVGSLGETVYSGAKAGIIGFTKALAREMARHEINVNCVCPGPTDTPMLRAVPERHREALLRAIPKRRFAMPSEVADAILFFANSQSDYVTGQVLSVSGGLTMVD